MTTTEAISTRRVVQPGWPAWFAPAGFAAAMVAVLTLVGMLAAVLGVDSSDAKPGFTLTATLLQDVVLVVVALLFAYSAGPVRAALFGLRPTPVFSAIGWTVAALVGFYALTALYAVIVQPDGGQSVVEDLGAKDGTGWLIATAALVVLVAPFVEEVFFRGFFYGALRGRFGIWAAAGIDGALFGAIHYSGADTLAVLPPLALLGVIFCLLYERTGSLYPVIALHTFNNAVALSAQTDGDAVIVSVAFAAVALTICGRGLTGGSR